MTNYQTQNDVKVTLKYTYTTTHAREGGQNRLGFCFCIHLYILGSGSKPIPKAAGSEQNTTDDQACTIHRHFTIGQCPLTHVSNEAAIELHNVRTHPTLHNHCQLNNSTLLCCMEVSHWDFLQVGVITHARYALCHTKRQKHFIEHNLSLECSIL